MSSALRRLSQQAPRLTRGLKTGNVTKGGAEKYSHEEVVYGDGHHGLRKGYTYDFEHGPHYLQPEKIPNFWSKFYAGTGALYAVGLGVPLFAVWWQQSKLKA
ncbi:hypothetical protein CHLRE_07g349350v5 [Chlamydomonas reinhardtii]|jgi:hypothetical protein|uniref:Uncharacterized protein n=1 Tax=Chlamydomonas reinhardtii TaxID=3055 RepID=A8IU42_CHLRE|nr:uncharacterized protein CHLRE_07g349350v5 [Chlamydomonas reinhardtii]PNW81277.1 hypothetical protein CHLRE_07g349350v5 [Chlamydomonas reinhardtii]|eukprot:XP_001692585.1 predicted protein [Chlamydomonas reinhardtii]